MDADVAIVGGGPAGCATALALRASGHSVAVIATPDRREKPTETAVPALDRMLHRLGAGEALRACEPCYGICSMWGRDNPVLQPSIINPLGHAWFVHRGRFDGYMQNAARKAGTIWLEAVADSVDFDTLGVSIRTTESPVRARWLVAATGSPLWPAHVTGQRPSHIDSLVAFWTKLPVPLSARLLFVEPTDCGWWYMCPADGNDIVVCLVTDPRSAHTFGASQRRVFTELFRATTLFGRLPDTPSVEFVRAVPTGIVILPQKIGHHWVAVGDAAMKLDPIGSSGTMTALDSGWRAAEAINDGLQGNATLVSRYARWSTGLIQEFIRQRDQQYAIESSRRVGGFWNNRRKKAA